MTPLVSVIIPTHDRPELVPRAVRSVLAQTYRDLELIVVDVGLTMRAKEALKEFEGDSRFTYIESPEELLGGKARNLGASHARGEYLAFLDDDDEWVPEKLATQVGYFAGASADVGFSFTAVENDYGDGKTEVTEVHDGIGDFSEIAYRRLKGFLTVTLVVRTEVFRAVGGFDEDLPSHQDPELIMRIAQKWKGLGVNIPLTRVNMRADHASVGKSLARRIRGREMVVAKHLLELKKRPQVLAYHYFQIALWYRDAGDERVARSYFWKAAHVRPTPRYIIHALRTLL